METWNNIDITPPDELVEVQDENGNIAKAYPCIYPCRLVDSIPGVRWSGRIEICEPYWDGGWMVACEGLESNIEGKIIKWREI